MTTATPNEYDVQAQEFITKYNLTLSIKFKEYAPYFPDDKQSRDIYTFRLTNKETKKYYQATFGNSCQGTSQRTEPRPYDILACLDTYG
jgi:hypothetical protein